MTTAATAEVRRGSKERKRSVRAATFHSQSIVRT
jgi:hypothetical protein